MRASLRPRRPRGRPVPGRDPPAPARAGPAGRRGARGPGEAGEAAGPRPAGAGPDVAPLRVPRVSGTRRRVPEEAVVAALTRRYGPVVTPRRATTARAKRRGTAVAPRSRPVRTTPRDVLRDLARRLTRDPSPLNLAQLTRACLQHPDELPRVAAAAAHFEVSTRPEAALEILVGSLGSRDPLARTLAATALSRIAPGGRPSPGASPATARAAGPAPLPDEPPGSRHVRPEPELVAARRRLPRIPPRGRPAGPLRGQRPLRLVGGLERRRPRPRRGRSPRVGRGAGPGRPEPVHAQPRRERRDAGEPGRAHGGRSRDAELPGARPQVRPGLLAGRARDLDPGAPRPGHPGRRRRAALRRPAHRGERPADLVRPLREPRAQVWQDHDVPSLL